MELNTKDINKAVREAVEFIPGESKITVKVVKGDKQGRFPSLFIYLKEPTVSNYTLIRIARAILRHEDDHILICGGVDGDLHLVIGFQNIKDEFFLDNNKDGQPDNHREIPEPPDAAGEG